ncbi:TetR/AcrR family transcriptional regulator [Dactylosporangium sp. NPDC048998]|uniref:TetR/AcrR family transcriptional regulator n=1 Tax=Dactylosporangium sp. NPDC048998 TaxID=3363976 RepID=UPI003713923C
MTDLTPPRRRAPGMTTEQRREMILQSALPLVAEHGSAVTTAQIARAAGIGEATVFRVFADKDELLQACIERALDPTNVLRELRSISLDQPLADRLVEAADALSAHLGRMGAVIGALHASGHHRRRPPVEDEGTPGRSASRDASQAETKEAVAELFHPESDRLRLPVGTATDVFLGILFSRGRFAPTGSDPIGVADLVDLFLHGALRQRSNASSS